MYIQTARVCDVGSYSYQIDSRSNKDTNRKGNKWNKTKTKTKQKNNYIYKSRLLS